VRPILKSGPWLLPALMLCCAAACAETVKLEIQGVNASDPGKKPAQIPESLAKYNELLSKTTFGTFKDAGRSEVKVTAADKGSTKIGAYTIEVALVKAGKEKARVTLTIKEGAKDVAQPTYLLAKGTPTRLEVGKEDAPTILILTLQSIE